MFSKYIIEILYAFIASTGGAAKYLNEYLKTGDFLFHFFLANLFVSGFSGYMFAKFAFLLGMGQETGFIFAGLGGWLGSRSLDFIEGYLKEKTLK